MKNFVLILIFLFLFPVLLLAEDKTMSGYTTPMGGGGSYTILQGNDGSSASIMVTPGGYISIYQSEPFNLPQDNRSTQEIFQDADRTINGPEIEVIK